MESEKKHAKLNEMTVVSDPAVVHKVVEIEQTLFEGMCKVSTSIEQFLLYFCILMHMESISIGNTIVYAYDAKCVLYI